MLAVGPSTVFTEYIRRVLPGLGEDGVQSRAMGEQFEGVVATPRDPAKMAKSKGARRAARDEPPSRRRAAAVHAPVMSTGSVSVPCCTNPRAP